MRPSSPHVMTYFPHGLKISCVIAAKWWFWWLLIDSVYRPENVTRLPFYNPKRKLLFYFFIWIYNIFVTLMSIWMLLLLFYILFYKVENYCIAFTLVTLSLVYTNCDPNAWLYTQVPNTNYGLSTFLLTVH